MTAHDDTAKAAMSETSNRCAELHRIKGYLLQTMGE